VVGFCEAPRTPEEFLLGEETSEKSSTGVREANNQLDLPGAVQGLGSFEAIKMSSPGPSRANVPAIANHPNPQPHRFKANNQCRHEGSDNSSIILIPASIQGSSSVHTTTYYHPQESIELIQKPLKAYSSPYHNPSSPSSPVTASTATLDECCAPQSAQAPRTRAKMGFTKSQRIAILLGIDTVFFFIELVVGTYLPSFPRKCHLT
jgi:hypothetical protein